MFHKTQIQEDQHVPVPAGNPRNQVFVERTHRRPSVPRDAGQADQASLRRPDRGKLQPGSGHQDRGPRRRQPPDPGFLAKRAPN